MSDTTFARETIRDAFPEVRYGSVKAAQVAAYDFLRGHVQKNLKLRRVRQLWEGKANRVDGDEKDALRRAQIEEARREYTQLKRRLESLEAALAVGGQEVPGAPLAARGSLANGVGRVDRP